MKIILSLIQAFLFLISSFAAPDSGARSKLNSAAVSVNSDSCFTFEVISAAALEVTNEEKADCRRWFDENIRLAGQNGKVPAYSFTVGGSSLLRNPGDWSFEVGNEADNGRGGKESVITLRHKKSGLEARVEAVIYEEHASCEWTVYIVNSGDDTSPVISDFYAADCALNIKNPVVYYSRGSAPAANDFELLRSPVSVFPLRFSANGGRSESFLPFFNLSGNEGGAVVSVGWTGQWFTSVQKKGGTLRLKAKQESFRAPLLPGEEIRSPLVCLSFYRGDNPLKGFRTLRDWETDCLVPENIKPMNGFVIANEFSTLTANELIDKINAIPAEILDKTDYFWMDAGWYEYTEAWHDGVGNWTPDPARFPDGFTPLTDAIAEKGKRFLLWFEPERVREGTYFYNEAMKHDGWIVQNGSDLLWNLADPDALSFLSNHIAGTLKENGISMYRQDFNFTPLPYWEKADKEFYGGRKGICENHYVTGEYAYLDYLLANVDGLIIDNCASGGKRLDIEMLRRSLPLWRSDYNCGNADGTIKEDVLEATQAMTYGLSFWFPYSGTNRYFHSEYASRSAILTHQSVYEPTPAEYAAYEKISGYMGKAYYPIQPGGAADDNFLAMQFDCGDGSEGVAVIYKRENASAEEYTLELNGLIPGVVYTLRDFDNPETKYTSNSAELMVFGITIPAKEAPKAIIIEYHAAI